MLALDIVSGTAFALAVLWGLIRGLTLNTLAVVAFGAGAVLGARVAPTFLRGGLHATYAPEVAIPAAIFVGGVFATVIERFGRRWQRGLDRVGFASPIGGALAGAALGLAIVWILGAVAVEIDSLRGDVRGSAILSRFASVLALPGPALGQNLTYTDPIPTIATFVRVRGRIDPLITRSPLVRAAIPRVMRVFNVRCQEGVLGTGWIAAKGVVVTNAHVIAAGHRIVVQLHGSQRLYHAQPIWFDPKVDVGILRVPGLPGRPLPITLHPKPGTPAAIIGYPLDRFAVRPVVLGAESDTIVGDLAPERLPPEFSSNLYGRPITPFEGMAEQGNSGSPIVDRAGRVVGIDFAVGPGDGYAVPARVVANALAHAGPKVSTGPCPVGVTP